MLHLNNTEVNNVVQGNRVSCLLKTLLKNNTSTILFRHYLHITTRTMMISISTYSVDVSLQL